MATSPQEALTGFFQGSHPGQQGDCSHRTEVPVSVGPPGEVDKTWTGLTGRKGLSSMRDPGHSRGALDILGMLGKSLCPRCLLCLSEFGDS